MIARIKRRWYKACLIHAGARLARDVQIYEPDLIEGDAHGLTCGAGGYFNKGVKIHIGIKNGKLGSLLIGRRFYINHYSILDCHHAITIGDRVMIGPHSYICDFDHDISPGGDINAHDQGATAPVTIGSGVWIGAGVTILKGVTIGEDAVVGAGSVVTREVAARTVVLGNPARPVRMRPVE
jgi:maltose O-acetyltransferase